MAMVFDKDTMNVAEVYLKYSVFESKLQLKQKIP